MKRTVLLFFILSFLCGEMQLGAQQLWRQRRFEAVAGFGPSFFFGDVGGFSHGENILGFKDLTFLQTRYNVNASFKYRLTNDLNVRLSLSQAMLKATDTRGSNENRSYESKINIFEPALIGEFYFIKNKNESSWRFARGKRLFRSIMSSIDVYTFTGFGGAAYSVNSNDLLQNKNLKKSGFTPVIPIGVGANLIYSADLDFGVEVGGRYSFSDYIDGYTSQFSSSNDVYYFLDFTVTYKMRTNRKGWPVIFNNRRF
ncbi:MAG TPA: hypothetical protein VK155_07330 [Bacteroidales bacterium]|nr:hypothetical protein [Bacteroidales bacterium]